MTIKHDAERRVEKSEHLPHRGLDPRPPDEVLVVASKVKDYIRERSGFNTSAGVLSVLSEKIRDLCDDAIRTAIKNERKTVMDRDFR
jgi:hypothetical protein